MKAISKQTVLTLIALLMVSSVPLTAQTSEAAKLVTDGYVLKEGSDVNLIFAEALSSKTAHDDDKVNFELAEDLKVGDVIVARKGTKAVGTVTHAKKSGMLGKGGELNIRLDYMKVGEKKIRLRASKGKEGEGKVGTTIALTVLFGPIGLMKHGKNVEIKQGTPLKAFVDDDVQLPVAE